MPTFHTVRVVPTLPPSLAPLRDLAYNLFWSWDETTRTLFQRLDPELWEKTGENPVRLLAEIDQDRLKAAADDPGFRSQLARAVEQLHEHLNRPPHPLTAELRGHTIVFFCFEFGIAACLPIYSGGLGILSGDYLKSASDTALPVIGIGLHYSRGYFRQYLNADGWQQQEFADVDYARLPIIPERRPDGSLLTVEIDLAGRRVVARVWRIQVGRIPCYMLDTNVPENLPEDRSITDRLYGGDIEHRIKQEIVLGIGGIRLLEALGIDKPICHMNEGHSAFLALERIRVLMRKHGLSFDEARELASASHVFTTHTPVPAGIDMFAPDLLDRYFGHYWPQLGLSREEFLGLGRQNPHDHNELFSMAVLGIRLSDTVNGVSQLHGKVSRGMWRGLWPDVPDSEVPITHVTNGVHHRSWINPELAALFTRYLGAGWWDRPADRANWAGVARIPDEELWRAHERAREQLVSFTRERVVQQLRATGALPATIEEASRLLDPQALTIGFARRFALYKRATLLFRDPDRLARILNHPERPVQIIIAGKAHPQDEPAKALIREIIHLFRRPDLRSRVAFIENYDILVAKRLVQGCDIWLNTPLRPQEASGTSGMKAACNGVLHVSTLDGWWAEAYQPGLGWAIGGHEVYPSIEAQNQVESELLYDLLEHEIVPTFYDRVRGVPRRWVQLMKNAIAELSPFFNTDRMIEQYLEAAYLPSAHRALRLDADGQRRARELAAWKRSLTERWSDIWIDRVEANDLTESMVGSTLPVRARVFLGRVQPEEVAVEAFYGPVDGRRQVTEGRTVRLQPVERDGQGGYLFAGEIPLETTGMLGYGVRVVPHHPDLHDPYEMRLVRWA
ncbi:MAG: alpha-glucan family phosphorylase [Chloroflexota bacterium]|nr:alpha-glucan family phosphorylase [Dehalococcoidia bacterium]MDW8254567.1 alpha-glucan family phosphorylase [Chloroflexota bacterium]